MMVPNAVTKWLVDRGYGLITITQPVNGGCINNGLHLETSSGQSFFLKTNIILPQDTFQREKEGLNTLRVAGGARIPQVFLVGVDFLLMEDLKPGPKSTDFWLVLGRQLAAVHRNSSKWFGFAHDNYLGSTPQPNTWTEDGYQFFRDQRLMFQARLAQKNGYFQTQEMLRVERLCQRLPEILPVQPASLLHGDLWSGNVMSDEEGHPAIIDPAVYYGWREAELGMTALFGGFEESFYKAYVEAWPLEPGWRERLPVYNLYHLLNHMNLFGSGYYHDVVGILKKFG